METTYRARFNGTGYGWHVYEIVRDHRVSTPRLVSVRNVSGPYTSREQAEAKATELRLGVDSGRRAIPGGAPIRLSG